MMRPRLMTPMKPKRREVSVESVEVERPWFLPAADQLQLHPVVEQHWGGIVYDFFKCCILSKGSICLILIASGQKKKCLKTFGSAGTPPPPFGKKSHI